MKRSRATWERSRDLGQYRYATMQEYPNGCQGHTLVQGKDGTGRCSCGYWTLWGSGEASLIRSHQFHIENRSTKARAKAA